jgi:hypothetical protein
MYGSTGYASAEPSPFTSPVSSFPVSLTNIDQIGPKFH